MNKQELIDKYEDKLKDVQLKFGANFKTKVYEGLVEDLQQLDESKKVTVPQFVAEWIEECKNDDFHLFGAMEGISSNQKKLDYWFREDDNMELFARAWLDGYEVEKENKYKVKFKNIQSGTRYLKYDGVIEKWYFGINQDSSAARLCHTKKELEEAGFGEVFNSPLFEVEKVE